MIEISPGNWINPAKIDSIQVVEVKEQPSIAEMFSGEKPRKKNKCTSERPNGADFRVVFYPMGVATLRIDTEEKAHAVAEKLAYFMMGRADEHYSFDGYVKMLIESSLCDLSDKLAEDDCGDGDTKVVKTVPTADDMCRDFD